MQTKIDKYFSQKGIKTLFNTLGNNETLVRAFVSNFYEDTKAHKSQKSQYSKVGTYNKMWTIQPRHKMTGFESLESLDNQFRSDIQKYIVESQHSPVMLVHNDEHDKSLSYKQELINFVKTIENPLVYLSGGVDSELVACAMIEAGIKFDVVIFEWTNNGNHIINSSEIFHAYRFCKKHGIIPNIKQINIEKLWQSDYFKRLGIELQIQSSHLLTYVHAIKTMCIEYTNSTHVFGGEVKFKTNYTLDNGNQSNLVWLDKLVPGYNGNGYSASFVGSSSVGVQISLFYRAGLFSPGTWLVNDNQSAGNQAEGAWTDTPAVPYEFNITYWNLLASDGSYTVIPASAPSGYAPITQSGLGITQICSVIVPGPGYGGTNYASVAFDISVRVIGETVPVQASSINLVAVTSYI